MDDRQALLLAAIANPDEDMPRLALADWLQEHGSENDRARAEYMRLQCQIARVTDTSPRTVQLMARADDLHANHAREWLGPLWELTGDGYRDREFHRGLLYWWYTTAGTFVKKAHQKAVCEQFPVLGVTRLMLTEKSARVKAVADSPALGWVCEFCWRRSRLDDAGFRALVASPHTARISDLEIDQPHFGDRALSTLAKSSCWPNLRRVGLTGGDLGGGYSHHGILGLLNSENLPRLSELNLSGSQPGGFETAAFYADPSLRRLRVLWRGADVAMRHFAACPHFVNLEELSLTEVQFPDVIARAMLDNPAFAKLRKLTLYNINARTLPLSSEVERRFRDRFGAGLRLDYSALCHRS